jgi:hypothetical protein
LFTGGIGEYVSILLFNEPRDTPEGVSIVIKHFSVFVLFLFFTPCATMFNKRSQEIRFITNEPTQLIVA